MGLLNISSPLTFSSRPLHKWPTPLKRIIFYAAVILCAVAYLALIGGVVTIIAAFISWL